MSNQSFVHVFDEAGVFPYFCIPHELAGMSGTVTVLDGTPVAPITWGRIKRVFENTRGTPGGMR